MRSVARLDGEKLVCASIVLRVQINEAANKGNVGYRRVSTRAHFCSFPDARKQLSVFEQGTPVTGPVECGVWYRSEDLVLPSPEAERRSSDDETVCIDGKAMTRRDLFLSMDATWA